NTAAAVSFAAPSRFRLAFSSSHTQADSKSDAHAYQRQFPLCGTPVSRQYSPSCAQRPVARAVVPISKALPRRNAPTVVRISNGSSALSLDKTRLDKWLLG